MASAHVLEYERQNGNLKEVRKYHFAHDGIFFLSSCIKDINQTGSSINVDLLAIAIFDGGVVFSDKEVLDVLEGASRLASSSSTADYELEGVCG